MEDLDNSARVDDIRRRIHGKPSLKRFYEEMYLEYERCLQRCPQAGIVLEIGSGAGFAKKIIPDLVTSDILPYEGIDQIIDGTKLPFADQTLRMICMMNVFHHIPDVESFLREAQRCLMPGGRVFIVDQHVGLLSNLILKYIHHEPFLPEAEEWKFKTKGPLSGANGALAWIVFVRDIILFRQLFPQLCLSRYEPHTPLRYWLIGGLKKWNLIPSWAYGLTKKLDHLLSRLSSSLCSFVYIEIKKEHM